MSKGSAFERATGKALSLWVTGGEDRTQLIRSVQSGGWAGRREGDVRQAGDLAANGPAGDRFRAHFAVECKHRKGIDLWHLWTADPGRNIAGWWGKLWAEVRHLDPMPAPLLVVKLDYRPALAGVPVALLQEDALALFGEDYPLMDVMTFRWSSVFTFADQTFRPPALALLRFDDLLTDEPERWYAAVAKWGEAWAR